MKLVCPSCLSTLRENKHNLTCVTCNKSYPIIKNIPILIDDEKSIFKIQNFENNKEAFFQPKNKLSACLPTLSFNFVSKKNFFTVKSLFSDKYVNTLIIGSSIDGVGVSILKNDKKFQITNIDVSFGDNIHLICDAHNIPFENEQFDLVIIQAVLEHVIDPTRVVSQVWRVLKYNGIVYSEIPFMQHLHGRQYDFRRYTMLGHALLFKDFKKIDLDILCGPAMSFVWSIQYFLTSFFNSTLLIKIARLFARIFFPLKYLDIFLNNKRGAYNSASAFYFLGRKTEEKQTNDKILDYFKGY
jgi:SAM-dependent methyltransferase/uncharacterized protein YbaR (Trm112 family)